MIVRPVPDGLLCFRQIDHAALSGELASAWGGTVPPLAPRAAVQLAIAHHDAGWAEVDRDPVWNPATGLPHTYRTYAVDDALRVAQRSVALVGDEDPYAGWLVSRHFASFHSGSEAPAARAWVTAQVGHRAELLSRAWPRVGREALHPHVLEANFDWLQLLDALSLALCEAWDSWESRETCAEYGERTTTFRYDRRDIDDEPLRVEGRVDPWPFVDSEVRGTVAALRLRPGVWADAESLSRAWRDADPATVEMTLSRG
ncbi:MAG TPA: DUF3891 family protein [Gemmatimonadota bacterium]|nr:DUF3891 family protein [Gemmatimonadota bacterium]